MRLGLALGMVLLVPAHLAGAEPPPSAAVTRLFEALASADSGAGDYARPPRFAITVEVTDDSPRDVISLVAGATLPAVARARRSVVALSADRKVAWISADLAIEKQCHAVPDDDTTGDAAYYRPDYCKHADPDAWYHGSALYERTARGWQAVLWHVAGRKLGGNKAGAVPDPITRAIEPGAEAVAKQFEATIGDPAAFARTVADRKDVVLLGSEQGERIAGGKHVRAQLAGWNLRFAIDGGVRAGLTASPHVAWVAANLTARSVTYRATFVYEQIAGRWCVVLAQLSTAE